MRLKWENDCVGTGVTILIFARSTLINVYVKVNGRWAYLYRAIDNKGHTVDFYLSPRRNSKAAYRFLDKIFNNMKKWQIPRFINTDKMPT